MRTSDSAAIAYLYLTLTALCLAANHVIGRGVHGDIPPVGLSFWRWIAGALMLLLFIPEKHNIYARVLRPHLRVFAQLGGMVVGSTTLILLALNFTTAINVSVINVAQPVLTVCFAWVFLGERLKATQVLGVCAACGGVVVMISQGHWGAIAGLEFNGGDLITLVAMCGFSAYAINVYRIPSRLSFVESLFGIIVAGSVMLLPFYIAESFFYRPMPVDAGSVLAVLALALLVSVLGMLMWNFGNRRVGPSRAAVFISLIPVFGVLLATTFLGERVFYHHLLGAALIFCGILLVIGLGFGVQKQ